MLRLLLLAGSLLLSGCLMVPVNLATSGSRDKIGDDSISALQVGISTRKDVVLLLGEPDYVSEDERQLRYVWSRVHMLWMSQLAAGGMGKTYTLLVTFSPEGVLEQTKVVKAPLEGEIRL